MRYDPDLSTQDRNTIHQRRRAQRAEAEAAQFRAEAGKLHDEAVEARRALTAYLNGPEHQYDLLRGAETILADAIRQLATEHRTCGSCGGFSRAALDDLLGPALRKLRDDLGLPDPDDLDERARPWPVQPGQGYYARRVLKPYEREKKERSGRGESWRPPHWGAPTGLSDW